MTFINKIEPMPMASPIVPASITPYTNTSATDLAFPKTIDLQNFLEKKRIINQAALLTTYPAPSSFELTEMHHQLFDLLLAKSIQFSAPNYRGSIGVGTLINHLKHFCSAQGKPEPTIEITGGYVRWVLLNCPVYCQKILNDLGCEEASKLMTPEYLEKIRRYPRDYDIRIHVSFMKKEDLHKLVQEVIYCLAKPCDNENSDSMMYLIQQHSLSKKKVTLDRDNQYATITFGKCDRGSELELLFIKKLKRNHLFTNSDAHVQYVNGKWLLYSPSKNLPQYFLDLFTQNIHALAPHEIDKNGWPTLISYISKGYAVPEKDLDKILLEKLEPGSENFYPTIEQSLARCLKNHHDGDALDAITIAFNASICLKSNLVNAKPIDPQRLATPFLLPSENSFLSVFAILFTHSLLSFEGLLALMETVAFFKFAGNSPQNSAIPFKTIIRHHKNSQAIQIEVPGKRFLLVNKDPKASLTTLLQQFPKTVDNVKKDNLQKIILNLIKWEVNENQIEEIPENWMGLRDICLALNDHTETSLRILGYYLYVLILYKTQGQIDVYGLISRFPDIFYHVSASSEKTDFLHLMERVFIDFKVLPLIESLHQLQDKSAQERLGPVDVLSFWLRSLASTTERQLTTLSYSLWLKYAEKLPSKNQLEIGKQLIGVIQDVEVASKILMILLKHPKISSNELIDSLETIVHKLKHSAFIDEISFLSKALTFFNKSAKLDELLTTVVDNYLFLNNDKAARSLLKLFENPQIQIQQEGSIKCVQLKQSIAEDDLEVASANIKEIFEGHFYSQFSPDLEPQIYLLLDKLFAASQLKIHLLNLILFSPQCLHNMTPYYLYTIKQLYSKHLPQEARYLSFDLLVKVVPLLFDRSSTDSNSDKMDLLLFLNSVLKDSYGKLFSEKLSMVIVNNFQSICVFMMENNLYDQTRSFITCLDYLQINYDKTLVIPLTDWLITQASTTKSSNDVNWIEPLLQTFYKKGQTLELTSITLWIELNLNLHFFDHALVWLERAFTSHAISLEATVKSKWLAVFLKNSSWNLSKKSSVLLTHAHLFLEHPELMIDIETILNNAFDSYIDYKIDLLSIVHKYGIKSVRLWKKAYEWIGKCTDKKKVQHAYRLLADQVDALLLSDHRQERAVCWISILQAMDNSGLSLISEVLEKPDIAILFSGSSQNILSIFSLINAKYWINKSCKKSEIWEKACESLSLTIRWLKNDIKTRNSIFTLLLRCNRVEGFCFACEQLFTLHENESHLNTHSVDLNHLRLIKEGRKFPSTVKNSEYLNTTFTQKTFWFFIHALKDQSPIEKKEFGSFLEQIVLYIPSPVIVKVLIQTLEFYEFTSPQTSAKLWYNIIEFRLDNSLNNTSEEKLQSLELLDIGLEKTLIEPDYCIQLLKLGAKVIFELELEYFQKQPNYYFGNVIFTHCAKITKSLIKVSYYEEKYFAVSGWSDLENSTVFDKKRTKLSLDLMLSFIEQLIDFKEVSKGLLANELDQIITFFTLKNFAYLLNEATVRHPQLAELINRMFFEWDNLFYDYTSYQSPISNIVSHIVSGLENLGYKALEKTPSTEHLNYYYDIIFIFNEKFENKSVLIGNWGAWSHLCFEVVNRFLQKTNLQCHLKGTVLLHDWIRIFWNKAVHQKDFKAFKQTFFHVINYIDHLDNHKYIEDELSIWHLLLKVLDRKKDMSLTLLKSSLNTKFVADVLDKKPYGISHLILYLVHCIMNKLTEKEKLLRQQIDKQELKLTYVHFIDFLNKIVQDALIPYYPVCFVFAYQLISRTKQQGAEIASPEFFKSMLTFLREVYVKDPSKQNETSDSSHLFQYYAVKFTDDFTPPSTHMAYKLWIKCVTETFESWILIHGKTHKEEIINHLEECLQLFNESTIKDNLIALKKLSAFDSLITY